MIFVQYSHQWANVLSHDCIPENWESWSSLYRYTLWCVIFEVWWLCRVHLPAKVNHKIRVYDKISQNSCCENVKCEQELTSKIDKLSLCMSSSSRLSATPRKLVFVMVVMGLSAKLKVFNSGNVWVINGTTVKSLKLKSK